MFYIDLPILLHTQTYNALPQRILLNYLLRLILWPILTQNDTITNYSWRFPRFLIFLMILVKLSQPPCVSCLITMLIFSQSQAKPFAHDIKHKTDLLDPAKPISHHRLQIMSEQELQKVQKHLQEYLEKG